MSRDLPPVMHPSVNEAKPPPGVAYPQAPYAQAPYGGPPQQKSGCGYWMMGCLFGLLLCLCVCGGIGTYLAMSWRTVVASVAQSAIRNAVQESELPPDQKAQIITQLDRVAEEFKANRITMEQAERLTRSLTQGPIFLVLSTFVVEAKYITPSGLSAEEKLEAHLTLQRVVRGLHEEKFAPQLLENLLDHISTKKPNGEREFREKVTDAEIRAFLNAARQLADDHNIPREEFQVDLGQLVKEAVDDALAPQAEEAPQAEQAPPK